MRKEGLAKKNSYIITIDTTVLYLHMARLVQAKRK